MSYPCWPLPFLRDLDKFRATNGRECFHEYSKKSAEITTTFQNKNDKKKLLIVHTYVVRYIKIRQNREQQKEKSTNERIRATIFCLCIHVSLCCYSSQQIPVGCWKNASFFAISLAYSSFEFFIFFPRIFPRRGFDRKDKACK